MITDMGSCTMKLLFLLRFFSQLKSDLLKFSLVAMMLLLGIGSAAAVQLPADLTGPLDEEITHRFAGDTARAEAGFATGCNKGGLADCHFLAVMHHGVSGRVSDLPQVRRNYRRACDGGLTRSCHGLALTFMDDGRGRQPNPDKAARMLARICDAGDMPACVSLSLAYETGDGVPLDKEVAATLLLRACNGGHLESCTFAAYLYLDGDGVDRSPDKALQLMESACNRGRMLDCHGLALIFATGEDGIGADPIQSMSYFRLACDGGYLSACHSLGVLQRDGEFGVKIDYTSAMGYLRKACTGEEERACSSLGQMFENGQGVPQDRPQALALYRLDCDRTQNCYDFNRLQHKMARR